MTEPTVQVTVALQTLLFDYLYRKTGTEATIDAIYALLSQPTPTTEPHFIDVNELQRQAETDKIGSGENDHGASEALHATALNVLAALSPEQRALQQQRATERRERNARIFNETAAPPSIADMVPGTTFTEEVRWTVTGTLSTGATVVHSDRGEMRFADRIDSSTIRDVTPPK